MHERYCDRESIEEKAKLWIRRILRFVPPYRKVLFDIEKASLLVVDMQLFFTSPESHAFIPTTDSIIPNITALIEVFRFSNRPILFTYYATEEGEAPLMSVFWRDVLHPGSPLTRIDPRIPRPEGSLTIRKPTYSSFSNPTLADTVQRSSEQVVVCGVMTHLCCDTAAKEAFVKGVVPFLVADATASVSEELHLAALASAAHGYAVVTLTKDILR